MIFDLDLKHYSIIKTATDTGAVRLIQIFKFNNLAIKNPTVTLAEKL